MTDLLIVLKTEILPPPTDVWFEVVPPAAKQWEINLFQPLPLLYLARLSHPLIVCGLPSAARETANAHRPFGSDVLHLRSMTPRTPATGKKQLVHTVLLSFMFPFLLQSVKKQLKREQDHFIFANSSRNFKFSEEDMNFQKFASYH